jgi:hypothetical protein
VYRLVLGPRITDLAGNAMNQNGNAVNGEAGDTYSSTVTFASTVGTPPGTAPNLYTEGFESWAPASTSWAFETAGAGTINPVTSGTPHGGNKQLLFASSGAYYLYQSAWWAVDLGTYSSATDLNINFWTKSTGGGTLYVDLSGSGSSDSWQNIYATGVGTTYTNYNLDLDNWAAQKNIAVDGDVYVRFRSYSYYGYDIYLDDVGLLKGDLWGPKVLSHSPVSVAASGGPLNGIRVTFDEPILASSFTWSDDVSLKDPQGNAISTGTVSEVSGSNGTQWDLGFADQAVRGVYRLVLGPRITDLAGNAMNQNGNAVNGEAGDTYSGTVTFAPTVGTPPGTAPNLYTEGFESWPPASTSWAFATVADATISTPTSGTPHGGSKHLLLHTTASYQYLSTWQGVDLASYSSASDLNLNFWAKSPGGADSVRGPERRGQQLGERVRHEPG